MNSPLTRQQRRLMTRYAAGVELATDSDRRWFEEHPGRRFRIRRMCAAEIGSASVLTPLRPAPPGRARFTLVKKVADRCRMRIFIFGPEAMNGQETTEAVGASLWAHHLDRNPAERGRELALAACVTDHDGGDGA